MKKLILSVCALVLISVFHISCNKDDIQPNKKEGIVEFGFTLKAPLHSGPQKSSMNASTVAPAAVVVTIKKANGNPAYTMQKVDLYTMNGYYISKPLSLLPGNYTVEQFLVVDAADSVVYASPVQGSPKAYLVSKPLPINFTVGKDNVTKVVPEVLSTANSTPEDFGYTTFSFDVVNTFDFLIGVFVYNEAIQNFELTTANLTIAAANKTIYTDTLAAITNKVTLNDGYDNYLLTVTKDGYKTWIDTLTAAELKLHFKSTDKGPLEVIMEKGDIQSECIKFTTDQTNFDFQGILQLYAGDRIANLVIDWGDGVVENIILLNQQYYQGKHIYGKLGIYHVKVSGDINEIINFALDQNKSVTSIDLTKANNLEYLVLNDNKISELDLTQNHKLKWVEFSENRILAIDLSKNDKIENLVISGNGLSSIDLSNLSNLKDFTSSFNERITKLDFSNCHKIQFIRCLLDKTLSELVIGQNTVIKELKVGYCALTSLDVSECPNLEQIVCPRNNLINIDISNCKNLTILNIDYNLLKMLDVSKNTSLRELYASKNKFDSTNTNKILADIITNVDTTNILNGIVSIYSNQPPTGQGLIDKQTLINTYGWTVVTD